MMSVAAQGAEDADGYDGASTDLLYEPVEGDVGLFHDGVDVPYAIKVEGDVSAVDDIDLYTGRQRSREEIADHLEDDGAYDSTFDEDDLMDDDMYARIRNEETGPTVEYSDGTVERLEVLEDGDVTYLFGMDEIGFDEPGRYALKTDVTYDDGTVESTGWTGAAIVDEFGLNEAHERFEGAWKHALADMDSYDTDNHRWRTDNRGPRGFGGAWEKVVDPDERDFADRSLNFATSMLDHAAGEYFSDWLSNRLDGFRSR